MGRRRLLRPVLLALGCLCVILAVFGIFLPVLPTVPFLLLAIACFARSSDRFYAWLLNHNRLGPMIRPYLENEGMPAGAKFKAILLVWISIGVSVVFFVPLLWLKMTLLTIALGVTAYILKLPVRRGKD